jgi:hypothetical protein
LPVALIDLQVFPHDKLCGDRIGPAAVRQLNEVVLSGIFTSNAYRQTRCGSSAPITQGCVGRVSSSSS